VTQLTTLRNNIWTFGSELVCFTNKSCSSSSSSNVVVM